MNTPLDKIGYEVLCDMPLDEETLLEVAQALGTILPQEEQDATIRAVSEHHANIALTRKAVPWHTEKMYARALPSYVILVCEEPGFGGRTLLLDGEKAAATLLAQEPRLEKVVLGYSKGDVMITRPLIAVHPRSGNLVLRYRQEHPERLACSTIVQGNGLDAKTINSLVGSALTTPDYEHSWTKGDVLVIDNLRMLHARNAYIGERVLHRMLVQ